MDAKAVLCGPYALSVFTVYGLWTFNILVYMNVLILFSFCLSSRTGRIGPTKAYY